VAEVEVEEVGRGKALARFTDLPQVLHGGDPRWAPPVLAWERYRLDTRRNPYFERADACFLLARRLGRPVGRVVAHRPDETAPGRFGFWSCDDDLAVADALLTAARRWLTERGCRSMVGPLSFEPEDEPGLLVEGHEHAGLTGRPWQPRAQAELLVALGATTESEQRTWRLRATATGPELPSSDDPPGQAGGYVDPRLVLDGVAAVPDLSRVVASTRLRGAWALARRARLGQWDTCTIVRCTADPAMAVPALQAAAGRAGYATVIAPWSPDGSVAPETVHRTFRFDW
jgi:hypothetical protein